MHSQSASLHSNQWYTCPQLNPEAVTRLFIFPYAGGSPAAFNKWSIKKTETWTAHYPGRGSRYNEPPIKELAALVERLSQSIQPLLDKPFAFFGHSLGGLVAFELARTLRHNHLPQPITLFVSACDAPHIPDPHPPIHDLPDAEFLLSLKELNGIPSELLLQSEAMQLLLPTLRADFELIESYHYDPVEPPLDCPIIAFGGLDDPRVSRERVEGWALHTDSRIESNFFPGDHFFINSEKESITESITKEINPAGTGKNTSV